MRFIIGAGSVRSVSTGSRPLADAETAIAPGSLGTPFRSVTVPARPQFWFAAVPRRGVSKPSGVGRQPAVGRAPTRVRRPTDPFDTVTLDSSTGDATGAVLTVVLLSEFLRASVSSKRSTPSVRRVRFPSVWVVAATPRSPRAFAWPPRCVSGP